MKITGDAYFIVLKRNLPSPKKTLQFFDSYSKCHEHWTAGSLISPIFPIDSATLPNLSDRKLRRIYLIGPVHPGEIKCKGELFISLGIFNIVVLAKNKQDYKSVDNFISQKNLNCEIWHIRGSKIERIEIKFKSPAKSRKLTPLKKTTFIKSPHPELSNDFFEYQTQMLSLTSRSSMLDLLILDDFSRFDSLFKEILNDKDLTNELVRKQAYLTLANSVLSRYSSQVFGGTTPITSTECNIWSHSLFGVGIASLALQSIRNFIEKTFIEARFIDRLEALNGEKDITNEPISQILDNDDFWKNDHLYDYASQKNMNSDSAQFDDILPLLTCFSGKDGFRNTEIYLSAPTAVIDSCNTIAWTLLTLTHEISHTLIDAVFGELLPSPDDEEEINEMVKLLDQPEKTMLDRLREMLWVASWMFWNEAKEETLETDSELIMKVLRSKGFEVKEILTHIFDFLYFYNADEEYYVRSIWISWGLIPNIRDRTPKYIIRTLCALHSIHLREGNERFGYTIDRLLSYLSDAKKITPESTYITYAIEDLENNRSRYERSLADCELLVKFTKYFLYSDKIQTMLTRERDIAGGKSPGGYLFRVKEFSSITVKNPLKFIETFSKDKRSNKLKSVWMLQQIAFGEQK